ncbi:MAG: DUF3990 domain-containing protein [Prevotella sp.]|nr:DUF3990 domain-containing protein [Prevotella sp.]MBR3479507.1 DUF3990 domain-containing protein [Prevotella sp.]MBR6187450.1 DUF3990 domain-containing protein [Prevotella sp.]
MKLYHGSNMSIDEIDLKRGRRGKDFGQGFYLSADRSQAQMMAERTVDREESGEATVTNYLFDDSILFKPSDLKVKVFEGYSIEWAEFILMNRRNKTYEPVHDYDIVYGPIADDKVGLQISRYQLQYIPMDELIRQLSFIRPTFQYFFGTERAIRLLHKIDTK